MNDREFLKNLRKIPENFVIIRYALFQSSACATPKITSISIIDYNTEQAKDFSTHLIAEELQIEQEDVKDCFDKIELELLRQFYEFVREHKNKFWVHWNMRNINHGFEHLAHRYRVLGGKDNEKIPDDNCINLNKILEDRYGENYIEHTRLLSLMKKNGGRHKDFLTDDEEVDAFNNNEFLRLHKSTLVKTGFLYSVMEKMLKGKLKTNSRGWGVMIDKFLDSREKKVATLLFGFLGVLDFIRYIISL